MADVAQKANSGNDRKEGTAVVYVLGAAASGNYKSLSADNALSPTPVDQTETRFTNRFDDPQYYTA